VIENAVDRPLETWDPRREHSRELGDRQAHLLARDRRFPGSGRPQENPLQMGVHSIVRWFELDLTSRSAGPSPVTQSQGGNAQR
jgi:hypothetical protein